MHSSQANIVQVLQTNLLQEKIGFAELSNLLQQERTALETQSVDALSIFSKKKQQLTKNIELLGQARNQAISELSDTQEVPQISEVMLDLPINIQNLWKQVLELAEECHQSNLVNGKIIQINRNRVERSLQLLKSQKTDPGLTYSSTGIANTSRQAFRALEA